MLIINNSKKLKNKIGKNLNKIYDSCLHPGFLSFGSVNFYTLISPSSPYFVFNDLLLGLVGRSHLFPIRSYKTISS